MAYMPVRLKFLTEDAVIVVLSEYFSNHFCLTKFLVWFVNRPAPNEKEIEVKSSYKSLNIGIYDN